MLTLIDGRDGRATTEPPWPPGLVTAADRALETKDATRWRIKWYVGLAVFAELGVARLRGILP